MPQKKSSKLPLQKFAMVGTGIQGTQIAMIAARTGYEVTVYDPREGAFRQTFEKLRADLKAKIVTPIIPWNQWEACAKKVRQVQDLREAIQDADLVLEAVPENLEIKKRSGRRSAQRPHPAPSSPPTVPPCRCRAWKWPAAGPSRC